MQREAAVFLLGLPGLLSSLGAQDRDPRGDLPGAFAVERTSSGSIQWRLPASSGSANSGGAFAGKPAVAQDLFGNVFVAARDRDGAIWVNTFDTRVRNWASWLRAGGTMQGDPAIAATADGRVYLAARDRTNTYWMTSYTPGIGAGQWTPLAGIFSNDPRMTATPDGSVYIIGKDRFGALWSGKYTEEKGFRRWILGPGPIEGEPSITIGAEGAVYAAFRDKRHSLGIARLENEKWTNWFPHWDSVEAGVDPQAVEFGGKIYVTAADESGRLCYGLFQEGIPAGWQAWICTQGALRRSFTTVVGDQVLVYGVDAANQLWHFQVFGNAWIWHGVSPFEQ